MGDRGKKDKGKKEQQKKALLNPKEKRKLKKEKKNKQLTQTDRFCRNGQFAAFRMQEPEFRMVEAGPLIVLRAGGDW